MAFVSTLGASDANSFLSVARATSLLGDLPASEGVTTWLALSSGNKEKTLVAATMSVNPLRWKGRPTTAEQSLAWPRIIRIDHFYLPTDELPIDFEIGVAYMAAFLGSGGGYTAVATGDGGTTLRENDQYDEVELGDGALRVKFKQTETLQSGIQYIPPFSMDIFSRYALTNDFMQADVVKSGVARVNPYTPFTPRASNVRFINGQVYPRSGGWYSNPL